MFLEVFFKIINGKDFPIEKVTFLLKDTSIIKDAYFGVINLNIEPVERPGKKEAEAKKEKEREKEKLAQLKAPKNQPIVTKIVFDPEWNDKTVIMPTFSDKMMVISKNTPFGLAMRTNILECIYLHAKVDSETETKEEIRTKIELFVNNIENACIKKLKSIDNLDVFNFDVTKD